MRVLQVHNSYARPGGEDVAVDADRRMLEAEGHTVRRHQVQNPASGARAWTTLMQAPCNVTAARRVVREAQRSRSDIVHVHNTWFSLSFEVLHRLHRKAIPTVMTLHNYRVVCANGLFFRDGHPCTDCLHGNRWQGVRHRCYRGSATASLVSGAAGWLAEARHSLSCADRILVPSRVAKDVLAEAGLPVDQITVRYNVVEPYAAASGDRTSSRSVLFAARLSEEKGVRLLLRAWDASKLDREGFELVVVGRGPLENELIRNAGPSVRFVGYITASQLDTEASRARALVCPSSLYTETFGLSVAQALASGLPVLASAGGAPAELLGSLAPAWTVDPADSVDAWSAALRRLLDDDVVRDGILDPVARAALRNAGSSLVPIYHEILAARRRGDACADR